MFDARTAEDLIALQSSQDAPSVRSFVPSVPEPVSDLVASLLARDPSRRFGSAALLSARLKELYYATLRGGDSFEDPTRVAPIDPRGSEDAAFVGRTTELAVLNEEADAVAAGDGRSILLIGEAGIGKSRLVAEVIGSRIRRQAIVTHGRCRHIGELLPYAPLREVLGQFASTVLRMGGSIWTVAPPGARPRPGHRGRRPARARPRARRAGAPRRASTSAATCRRSAWAAPTAWRARLGAPLPRCRAA